MSVLLPLRDAQATLPECLDSLAAQTLGDHEVVAVDDGSRDASLEILRAYARRDRRLCVAPTSRRSDSQARASVSVSRHANSVLSRGAS